MQIHRVPRPEARDADPHPLTLGINACELVVEQEIYGHTDYSGGPRERTVRAFGSDHGLALFWAALPDGIDPEACAPTDVLGYAEAGIPLTEDTTRADLHVAVRPDARGCGVARALWEAAHAELAERGRTTLMAFAYQAGPGTTGPDALVAESGSGAADGAHPTHRWLQRLGFSLEQCERPSTLGLGDHDAVRSLAGSLASDAAASAGDGYELVGWRGPTPQEHHDHMAYLISRMSTDTPVAGLEFDEQVWDSARLAAWEDRLVAMGRDWVTTAARDRATGELVAFTRLEWPDHNHAGIWQEDTLVRSDHRGHRLGMLVKAANLIRLVEANPRAQRVHTWNADENEWMLAINDALGFVPHGLEGMWQRTP